MSRFAKLFSLLIVFIIATGALFAHCQIPCGIYGDKMRFDMMREHITTIEKSMQKINELSNNAGQNINQLVRWVENKDIHADQFTEIVTYYFLAQRIKMIDKTNQQAYADYQNKVTLLHQMVVYSMKCKQTTDLANVEKLKLLIDEFEKVYFSEEDIKHLEGHKK